MNCTPLLSIEYFKSVFRLNLRCLGKRHLFYLFIDCSYITSHTCLIHVYMYTSTHSYSHTLLIHVYHSPFILPYILHTSSPYPISNYSSSHTLLIHIHPPIHYSYIYTLSYFTHTSSPTTILHTTLGVHTLNTTLG